MLQVWKININLEICCKTVYSLWVLDDNKGNLNGLKKKKLSNNHLQNLVYSFFREMDIKWDMPMCRKKVISNKINNHFNQSNEL